MIVIARLTSWLQRCAAKVAYRWYSGKPPARKISWVVGPDEFASMLVSIGDAVPDAFTVCLQRHPFYSTPYDYEGATSARIGVLRMIAEGWVFGRLGAHARGFIYLGAQGFLRAQGDARAFEFEFLKQRGLRLCVVFTGSDIRSIRVMAEQEKRLGIPNVATYLPALSPVFASESYDLARKALAQTADTFADVIISASKDQAGYLTRKTDPFMYFYPEDQVIGSLEKFDAVLRPVVVHAPSSPVIKGTQLVRAAIATLRDEGLDFEYVELIGVPHEEVTLQLQRAHIVLNQFFAYIPGVFGIEAMAAGAVVMQSADEGLEPDLPQGSNSAWVVTPSNRVTEELRRVLQLPGEELRAQAETGRQWVLSNAVASVSREKLHRLLGE